MAESFQFREGGQCAAVPMCAARGLLMALVLLFPGTVFAQADMENKVKSAFLYNFAKFVVWPPDSLPAPNASFTFCTLGEHALGGRLEEAVRGKTVDDRSLATRAVADMSQARGCQVLFLSSGVKPSTSDMARELHGTLVVSDSEDPQMSKEAVISFVLYSNRVRFIINSQAAERAGLVISSRLLSLALKVIP